MYSLRKSQSILHKCYAGLQKKKNLLSQEEQASFEEKLQTLEEAIFDKDRPKADGLAKEAEALANQNLKKSYFESFFELAFAILMALVIAIVVRQVWFELFQIPTGSMRPSYREEDFLSVTKTAFGLNIPLYNKHLYFDKDLVQRAGAIIFSAHDIPLPDTDTHYFFLIPDKKRYIKRLIGKPGDTLYFYGGKIYGMDSEGKPIRELLDDPWMQKLEHIPFITFEGSASSPTASELIFKHVNQPIGKLTFNRPGDSHGAIRDDAQWKDETPFAQENAHSLGDFWGIKNYAMVRLLTKEELENYTNFDPKTIGEGVLYLQIRHSPNLTYPAPKLYQEGRYLGIQIPAFESIIPLQQQQIDTLMDNLYTSRFVVKDGHPRHFNYGQDTLPRGTPHFLDIPEDTYEFYHGKAQSVGWKGVTSTLPDDHPLYNRDPMRVHELFNRGIEMTSSSDSQTPFQVAYPRRYAYFRDGDLYVMGVPVLKKGDPVLETFLERERTKASQSTKSKPYIPFMDHGAPLKEGELDKELVAEYGLKVPAGYYFVLGDNHAMSADSRIFGFVPENNLQGTPSFILWPPGERWGFPPQKPYPWFTLPRVIVWGLFLSIVAVWYGLHKKKMGKRLFPPSSH